MALWARRRISSFNPSSRNHVMCSHFIFSLYWFIYLYYYIPFLPDFLYRTLFNFAASAAPQISLCRSMLGLNPGLLGFLSIWYSYALTTWLDHKELTFAGFVTVYTLTFSPQKFIRVRMCCTLNKGALSESKKVFFYEMTHPLQVDPRSLITGILGELKMYYSWPYWCLFH